MRSTSARLHAGDPPWGGPSQGAQWSTSNAPYSEPRTSASVVAPVGVRTTSDTSGASFVAEISDELAPVFESPFVRHIAGLPATYFGLGIPPAQFDALKADAGGRLATLVRLRVERLACDFPIHENWFAWQAFGRRYPGQGRGLPPYLRPEHFQSLRERVARVDVQQITFTDFLRRQDAASIDAYVLLDAQDWMSRVQIEALWAQMNRTARAGARVIFRTAGEETPLPQMLAPATLAPWHYDQQRSQELHVRDRSAIYGGFHLYVRSH